MMRLMAFIVLGFCLAGPVTAQSVKLQSHEIAALLTGNTASGKWAGARYRQYFGADGVTIYAQENTRSARGKWRVDPERDEYQSIWPGNADWEGWYVMEYAGAFYWVSKKTPPTPFKVIEGQQLIKSLPDDPYCGLLTSLLAGDTRSISLPEQPDTVTACRASLSLSGTTAQHCSWPFGFRDPKATTAFDDLLAKVALCLGAEVATDQAVNHPDTYDLRTFDAPGGSIRVSLKDKGALDQTYVFLRAEKAAAE